MRIEIDDRSGFCFGVVNAIHKAEESLAGGRAVFSLGDIVHNRVEVSRLEAAGLRTISHAELPHLQGKTVLIRAHGEPPATYAEAAEHGVALIDATCPVVARLQERVKRADEKMQAIDGQVVILGKKGHAEVVGLAGQSPGRAIIVEGPRDLAPIDFARPVYLLSQTTQPLALFEVVRDEILRRAADPQAVTVDDTICRQVSNRDPHLREFARRHEVIVFVSGRKSSNGAALFGACLAANPCSHLVEDETELRPEWFAGAGSVGICGATSTPRWLMERVALAIEKND